MKRSSISSLLLCVALLTVAPGTFSAQDGQGIIRINGGSMTIALHQNPQKIEQSAEDPASLVTIYSDLGTGTNVYLSNIGWSVTGPEVAGGKVDSATPFTPKRDFNLVLVKVAILTVSGTNGVTLSLNHDSSGAPGTAIKTWNLVNLPPFPGCCKLDLARLKKTLRVKKGVQYWLTTRPLPSCLPRPARCTRRKPKTSGPPTPRKRLFETDLGETNDGSHSTASQSL
jgi:hypothetical protein